VLENRKSCSTFDDLISLQILLRYYSFSFFLSILQLSRAQKYESVHITAAAREEMIGDAAKVQFFVAKVTAYNVHLKHN
jgi:hypothetical protein